MVNRILVTSQVGLDKLQLLEDVSLIGDVNSLEDGTQSGIIVENVAIETKYYKSKVSIFVDEYQSSKEWFDELKSTEARELRDELQGIVVCIDCQQTTEKELQSLSELLESLALQLDDEYTEHNEELQWDGFKIVVGLNGELSNVPYEDIFITSGAEYIPFDPDLIRQTIESHPWRTHQKQTPAKPVESNADLTTPLLNHSEKELDFADVLKKLQAARLDASKLPQDERESFAEQFANEVLKNLDK
ncbi:hypothetical protein OGAPHI_002576 [Ogataea philodendri]|uniref:Increased recombination centers protein 6 n=1 Tax=Ogataea philodendri TaxID=1378263 RepID=A0A9P8T7H5_9ASCO|nr:uncharacterized protein OGAPHI_002576 [Ogataea philodendri]KAH3668821.1 hypothetical protein OGAPHI_002576 [Ogataea philodendri]